MHSRSLWESSRSSGQLPGEAFDKIPALAAFGAFFSHRGHPGDSIPDIEPGPCSSMASKAFKASTDITFLTAKELSPIPQKVLRSDRQWTPKSARPSCTRAGPSRGAKAQPSSSIARSPLLPIVADVTMVGLRQEFLVPTSCRTPLHRSKRVRNPLKRTPLPSSKAISKASWKLRITPATTPARHPCLLPCGRSARSLAHAVPR